MAIFIHKVRQRGNAQTGVAVKKAEVGISIRNIGDQSCSSPWWGRWHCPRGSRVGNALALETRFRVPATLWSEMSADRIL